MVSVKERTRLFSERAKKGWKTRRKNERKVLLSERAIIKCVNERKRKALLSERAKKSWKTRRKNQVSK